MAFLLDANIFIEANNRYYSFSICPGFWTWLDAKASKRELYSLYSVKQELTDPILSEWAQSSSFRFEDEDLSRLSDVFKWAHGHSPQYEQAGLDEFAKTADCRLVAHALANGDTVVTHEKGEFKRTNVKIPYVCKCLNVRCVDTFFVLNELKAKFVLAPS